LNSFVFFLFSLTAYIFAGNKIFAFELHLCSDFANCDPQPTALRWHIDCKILRCSLQQQRTNTLILLFRIKVFHM